MRTDVDRQLARVSAVRRCLLSLLPKVALSRTTGLLTALPLPRLLRGPFYRWFARRYGADLDQIDGELTSFRSLARFFQRPLRAGARPLGPGPLVWPCDGRIVTAGPLAGSRIPQVKGNDYELADLLGDRTRAAALADGSQATIYLAPGDYHRVHAPFAARLDAVVALPGTLFPVNPPAVGCIPRLFARNARHVFHCTLTDGLAATVVMVGAFNVGGTRVTATAGQALRPGDELGQFGFGSTVVVVIGRGGAGLAPCLPHQRVLMGQTAATTPAS
ncbi:MAG: phosphatidylserine decarboxylase [Planctomycetes bacterium]|nr:phosphatidylserine decarboxylase [Planctomycetota bacterium]